MSKKPKIRFGVGADMKIREIFSVLEGPDKSLTIVRRPPRSLDEHGIRFPFREQHYSIHNSERSTPKGTTITQKSRYDGRTRSRVAFIENTSEYLFSHVYSATTGFIKLETNLLEKRAKDTAIVFPHGFRQDSTTAIHSVYVTYRSSMIPILPNTSTKIWDFSVYRLHVLLNFIALPTPDMGSSWFCETSPQITDGVQEGDLGSRVPGKSFSFAEFADFHFWVVRAIAAKSAQNVLEDSKRVGFEASVDFIRSLADVAQNIQPLPIAVEKAK